MSPMSKFWARNGALITMTMPGVLLLFVFAYLPMFGVILAFKDYRPANGILGSRWVGLDNFRFLFQTDAALVATRNTLLLNSLFIVTVLIASLTVALLLNEVRNTALRTFYQSATFMPYFISWVVASYWVYALLSSDNGLINTFLREQELKSVRWYSTPNYWLFILSIVNLWKNVGFWSVVYLAGMIAIPEEYYEAARIDGANKLQQITQITLPLLMPLIIVNVLLAIGRIFYADFGLFYNVTRDQSLLYPITDVIDTYVFRSLRSLGDTGMSAAAGLYQAVVGFVLVIGANWVVRRWNPEQSLF